MLECSLEIIWWGTLILLKIVHISDKLTLSRSHYYQNDYSLALSNKITNALYIPFILSKMNENLKREPRSFFAPQTINQNWKS